MQVNQLEDDIYVLIGKAYNSNCTAFISDDEVLLVDALGSRADAEDLRTWIEADLKKQVRFIIATHYFCDHLAALNEFPNAKVIAHRNYKETYDAELYCSAEEKTHFREPDFLITDSLEIRWGRRTLNVFHNSGHTTSTLGVDISDADLLIVGDTLVGNIVYLAYSTPDRFVPALDRLQSRARKRLLSSHGNVRDNAAISNAQHYLKSFRQLMSEVRSVSGNEQSILEIPIEACLPPGLDPTSFERMFHERNLHTFLERKQ